MASYTDGHISPAPTTFSCADVKHLPCQHILKHPVYLGLQGYPIEQTASSSLPGRCQHSSLTGNPAEPQGPGSQTRQQDLTNEQCVGGGEAQEPVRGFVWTLRKPGTGPGQSGTIILYIYTWEAGWVQQPRRESPGLSGDLMRCSWKGGAASGPWTACFGS